MIVYKPSIGRAIWRWLGIMLVIVFIFVPFGEFRDHFRGYKPHEFSWIATAIVLAILSFIFILENGVTKIEIDTSAQMIFIHRIKFLRPKVAKFFINDTEVFFTTVPGARGGKDEVLRFKDNEGRFDIFIGLNGWKKEILVEIKDEIGKLKH